MLGFFKRHPPTVVTMEACGGSHHWARKLAVLGHEGAADPAAVNVKPYLERGKERPQRCRRRSAKTAGRPGIRFVPVKSPRGCTRRRRWCWAPLRRWWSSAPQLISAMRGHATEFSVISGQEHASKAAALLAVIAADTAIPPVAQEMLGLLDEQIDHLDCRIKALEVETEAMHKGECDQSVVGDGAGDRSDRGLSFAIDVDPAAFASGRHLAAWLGLTPQKHSTGGKQRTWAASAELT